MDEKLKITLKESVLTSGTDSIWVYDDDYNDCYGVRVSMTVATSAGGTAAPIVVCVSGLTERELPGTEFLVLEIPGLCIGGGANVGIDSIGYVLFMRKTEGAKQKKFEWYQKEILLESVKENRRCFGEDEDDITPTTEVSIQDTAVVSIDGDIPQLNAMKKATYMYDEHKIIFNKHNAGSSACEQSNDRNRIFKGFKRELPHHTVRKLPPSRCPMKKKVHKAFKSDKLCGLNLKRSAKDSVVDLIAVLPGVLSKVVTPESCQEGYVKNGAIDKHALRFPSFNGAYATMKQNPKADRYKHMRNNLVEMIKHYDEFGKANEDFLDSLGFQTGVGADGKELRRGKGGDHLQRAMVMNHPQVKGKREAEKIKCRLAKLRHMQEENEKYDEKMKNFRVIVAKLSKKAEEDGFIPQGSCLSDASNLEYCTLDTFDEIKAPELKLFIQLLSTDE